MYYFSIWLWLGYILCLNKEKQEITNFSISSVTPNVFRQSALELERMTEQRKQEEEAWYRQQKLLMEAEDQRRKMLEVEEKKLTDQRAR